MNKNVLAVATLIKTGGDWRTKLIEVYDCIKNLKDFELITTLLMANATAT